MNAELKIVPKGDEDFIRNICKDTFIIKQNNLSKVIYERLLKWKDEICQMRAKILTDTDKSPAELSVNDDLQHPRHCQSKAGVFAK